MATRIGVALVCAALGLAAAGSASAHEAEWPAGEQSRGHGIGHRLLFWIPNRVFDVLDLVRLRVRIGPGLSASARATELADVSLGGHTALFVGLRGPRSQPRIPWPAGIEAFSSAELSVLGAGSDEGEDGPEYGPLEIGAGVQAVILGIDVGVEPFDALDLALGILLLDPKGDDL